MKIKHRDQIHKAVRSNFGPGDPQEWKPTCENYLLYFYGFAIEADKEQTQNRHNTYLTDNTYRRRVKLVENHIELHLV